MEASERVFRSGMLSGSLWAVNLLFFPDATRLVQWLTARMPDQALKDLTEVGPLLGGGSYRLPPWVVPAPRRMSLTTSARVASQESGLGANGKGRQ